MDNASSKPGTARHPGAGVQDYLDQETRPVPEYLRDDSYTYMGSQDLPVERWISRDFHEQEVSKMWPRVWQMACLADDIPAPGDYITYDIGNHSFIITRQDDGSIKAFYNSCMHRATRLVSGQGKATNFRCPYHGWVHSIAGRVTGIPCQWDFPHMVESRRIMPEVRADVWQSLIFISIDPHAPSLAEYIGDLEPAFERYPLSSKYKSAHISKVIKANWKIGLEQFIESYHVLATHPEGLPYLGDANAQYNIWPDKPHISRMHTLHSVSSPHVSGRYTEQEMMDVITSISDKAGQGENRIIVPEGATTRQVLGQQRRALLTDLGIDVEHLTDAELIDTIHYFIFPNIVVWTAYGSPIIYRFRPNGDDHESHIMEIIFLSPYDQRKPKPEPMPLVELDENQSWTEAPALGRLGWVFDQDVANAPLVQAGLKASGKKAVSLGDYQEIRIRHFHATLDTYLER